MGKIMKGLYENGVLLGSFYGVKEGWYSKVQAGFNAMMDGIGNLSPGGTLEEICDKTAQFVNTPIIEMLPYVAVTYLAMKLGGRALEERSIGLQRK